MNRFHLVASIALIWNTVVAQIPPGYEVVYIETGFPFDNNASINDLGDIAITSFADPFDITTSELFIYRDGEITRITEDRVIDRLPDINNAGTIAWSRGVGANNSTEIFVRHNNTTTRLTTNSWEDFAPKLNQSGDLVWLEYFRRGCGNAEANIMMYDANGTHRIYGDGLSNQMPRINENGQITWTRYNFCDTPWSSDIMLYSDGVVQALTTDQMQPQICGISDDGAIAWYFNQPEYPYNDGIQLWQNGDTELLTGWGSGLRMNGRGDIAFDRWYDSNQTWQVWLYLRGRFWQITDDSVWNFVEDINDRGEVVWISGIVPTDTRIGYLRRMPDGDMNCDGRVDNFDIDPFVEALAEPEQYLTNHPSCDVWLADMNHDERVNVFDIDPFVSVVIVTP
ncbi:MAG: hypothetical protein JNG88_13635 [Phycisphaerales bacterium]|nr:hypothetical protein [Phycisphaerales bacterium]